jgi:Putative DNA-binding domain
MDLEKLQREVFEVIRQPLTASESMRERMLDGRAVKEIVEKIIKPNDRLTSFERLEIYNRVYWFRILSSLADDFPGLRAVVGQQRFDQLLVAYLSDCPSESFTLRNLGSRLEQWLQGHQEFLGNNKRLALDMVRLEWADIEAFDGAEWPKLTPADFLNLGESSVFHLQPNLRLLDLSFPVDDLLLKIREAGESEGEQESDVASNVVLERAHKASKLHFTVPKPKKTYLAVHRQDYTVYFKRLDAEAFALIGALREGKNLAEAIEVSVSWTHKRVERITEQLHDWFANWSQLGWFCRPPQAEQ